MDILSLICNIVLIIYRNNGETISYLSKFILPDFVYLIQTMI